MMDTEQLWHQYAKELVAKELSDRKDRIINLQEELIKELTKGDNQMLTAEEARKKTRHNKDVMKFMKKIEDGIEQAIS